MFRLEVFFDEMIDKINKAGLLLDETKIKVRKDNIKRKHI